MDAAYLLPLLLQGLSYGLLLYLLSAGLTVIFGLMGVINFAHAGFYMLGAYAAYSLSAALGFWLALLLAPLLVGLGGAAFERMVLRRLRPAGHLPELLATFGLGLILVEAVQLVWGRGPVEYSAPTLLQGPLLVWQGVAFPAYRAFVMAVSLLVLLALALWLARSRAGLVVRAALTHPAMVQALGHDLPAVQMRVFGGGTALAALAGVLGGPIFVTEPGMAAAMGSLLFAVVVIGGLGSLTGAFVAAMVVGLLQTLVVGVDGSLAGWLGLTPAPGSVLAPLLALRASQFAPLLPYLLLVLVLLLRPQGLLGRSR